MDKRVALIAALVVPLAAPGPLAAQADAWQKKWFWGAQGGAFVYQTASQARTLAITAGGHWLITGKRSALMIGFDQILFKDSTQSLISDATQISGFRPVDFSGGRRIQALLYAIPSDSKLQIMLGGGFAIQQITNAAARGPFASLAEETNLGIKVANQDTRAFAVVSAAVQMRRGRWALFANYQYMTAASNFLLTGEQQAISGGLRYALTTAHEEVTTQR